MKAQIIRGKDELELSPLVNRLLESDPDAVLGNPYIHPQTGEHYLLVTVRNGVSNSHLELPSVEEQQAMERENLLYLNKTERYSLDKAAQVLGLKLEESEELLGIKARSNRDKLYKK